MVSLMSRRLEEEEGLMDATGGEAMGCGNA